MLQAFIPTPRLIEIDHVDVAAPPARASAALRDLDLGRSALVRGLFALRTLPDRLRGERGPVKLRVADLGREGGPGFRVLRDEPGGIAIGAVGRFWEPEIPFADVSPERFADFEEPGYGKVAWALYFQPHGDGGTRIVLELRLTATDEDAWHRLRRYYRLIGPFSHLIRRHLLSLAAKELGPFAAAAEERALPGDELIPAPLGQATHGIDIEAPPERIWPWLLQLGCGRGGWYSYDLLDNADRPSARRLFPELQSLRVGDVLPATPGDPGGFTVLALTPERALVLGVVQDLDAAPGAQAPAIPFGGPLPPRYWRSSWAFVLEPLDALSTRLHVRVRLDFAPEDVGRRVLWMRPVHHFMQREQLRNLKRRAEGHGPPIEDSIRDVGEGIVGALGMVASLLTPFLRQRRSRWGLDEETAARRYPGDELIEEPTWAYSHGVEIDAPPEAVWPWVLQLGQGRAGFYSYQWLENLAGCQVENGERLCAEWQERRPGDELRIHPSGPPLRVVSLEPGRSYVAAAGVGPGEEDGAVAVSWLFLLEPLAGGRSRLISRYRARVQGDLRTRLSFGPAFLEPVSFVMDRRMLLGIKERAERGRGQGPAGG